jgi:small subunit ribosomal protein S1
MSKIVGEIYSGEVVHKDNNSYLLDLGIGFDAILLKEEAEQELNIGDQVNVIITHYLEEEYFTSMKKVSRKQKVEDISQLIGTNTPIQGKVMDFKNNRFSVDLGDGVKGSVYVRNMDTKFIDDKTPYIGNDYDFLVVEKNKRGFEDFDLNRRKILEEILENKKEDLENKFAVGQEVAGTVKSLVKGGLILDVDGTDMFVPKSEIAHYRLNEMPEIGTDFKAVVKEIQTRSLSLKGSIKELVPRPFEQVKNLKVDDIINGKIVRKADFGLFVEVLSHVEGLVHISEISYDHTNNLDEFNIGDEIQVKIINIDFDKEKIGLSIKRLLPSPYQMLKEKVNIGDTINVKVKRISETGVRVMVFDDYFTNIINEDIHDFSKVKSTLHINDSLEVIVTEMDDENEKIILSNEEYMKKQYELFEGSL